MTEPFTGSFRIYRLDGNIYGTFSSEGVFTLTYPELPREERFGGEFSIKIDENGDSKDCCSGSFDIWGFSIPGYDSKFEGNFLVDLDGQPCKGYFSFNKWSGNRFFQRHGPFPMNMENSWREALSTELVKEYFLKLTDKVDSDSEKETLCPKLDDIFTWTHACPVDQVKVVILGQDPYSNGQAHGLAFSVLPGTPIPRSLRNIYAELELEGFLLQGQSPEHGNLMGWARQGVLLLNTWLTVRANEPKSHRDLGWDVFTDAVIAYLNEKRDGIVFMLWGKEAQKKGKYINESKHTVLTARHPSPNFQSEGNTFIGNGNFLECNTALLKYKKKPICWGYLPAKN